MPVTVITQYVIRLPTWARDARPIPSQFRPLSHTHWYLWPVLEAKLPESL